MSTGTGGGEEFRRFAREHRVRYDVEAEPPPRVARGGRTFEVRLFATHGDDKLEAPGCPSCVELARDLRSFATQVVTAVEGADWAEVMEPAPVIYASTDQKGPDEVSIVLHVLGERPDDTPDTDPRVRRIEDHLKAVGAARR